MSLDAYLTRLPDDEPLAQSCDTCGRPRINQIDPIACQCPDDEAPECAFCHEDGAEFGSAYCAECNRIERESRGYAERAAQLAEERGDTLRAGYIRETITDRSAA